MSAAPSSILENPPSPAAPPRERLLPAFAIGQLVGFWIIAVVDAAMMAITARRPLPLQRGDRAAHYLYDIGLALGAGLLSMLAVTLFHHLTARARARAGSSRLLWIVALPWLSLAAAAFCVGELVLHEDLSGPASRSQRVPLVAMIAVVATSIPITAAAATAVRARLGGSRILRLAMALGGVGLAAANHLILPRDYDGFHLFVSWIAAIIVGCAISSDARPAASPPASRGARIRLQLGRIALAATAAAAIAAVASIPSNGLRVDLMRARGGSLAFWVARWRKPSGGGDTRKVASTWFADREGRSPIAPSTPPLLPPRPIVVMVTIDALRADLIASPTRAAQLPTFAKLKAESVNFTMARTSAPATSAAISALFSDKYFSQLYWTPMKKGSPVICTHEDRSPRLAELLDANGVTTVTFTGMPGLVNSFGFVRGFKEETLVEDAPFAMSPAITKRIIARLRAQGPEPLFLYVHFTDPHAPYDTGGRDCTEFECYVREVAIVDRELGRIRDTLLEIAPDRAALIVSADHGEAFGEHGQHFHGATLYEELMRVPLMMRLPGVAPRVVTTPVSLMDLAPTILDLFQMPTPGSFMGQSLTPFLRGQNPTLERPLVLESSRGLTGMVFPDGMKAIQDLHSGARELYDLNADPGELVNLADQRADASQYFGVVVGFHDEHELHRPGYTTPPFVH